MVPINSGSFFVLDKSAQRVTEFGNDGSLIDNVETLSGSFPSWPVNCGSGEFIGGFTAIDASGNDFNLAYRVCSFTIDLAVIDTLFTNSVPLNDYSDITYTLSNTIYSCAFTADTMGNVFIAPISTSEYSIYGYDTDNVQFLQIENELPRIGKSSAEIASEAERINSALRARNPGYSGSYTPCEYRYMIQPQGLHADNAGRLWVLRGTSANPVYDVYDYQGRHLFEVSVMGLHPEDTSDVLWWCISSQKILAFSIDPVNEPVVYVFNITF
ncbi:hypothetical protein CSA37_10905 [Candidatus Fermentibacteria bacterium]|nr:MAG: hypothetical protein CSA37_10905 [Candidatus Fermentibacteria bacterium]